MLGFDPSVGEAVLDKVMMLRFLVILLILGVGSEALADARWGAVEAPSAGDPHSHGFYSNGCLEGGATLPLTGEGYQVMRSSRNRFYGHPTLITYLEDLARQVAAKNIRLLVGDLSQPRGGPMSYGHTSHQIGLDADIWLTLLPLDKTLNHRQTESWKMLSVVDKYHGVVRQDRWTLSHRDVLQMAVASARVERIFVNPIIKLSLCRSESDRRWLRKLRPWWGHDAHFHVRLSCPPGSPACRDQDPVPPGDGCQGVEDWVAEIVALTRNPPPPKPPRKKKPKVLPQVCQAVLSG